MCKTFSWTICLWSRRIQQQGEITKTPQNRSALERQRPVAAAGGRLKCALCTHSIALHSTDKLGTQARAYGTTHVQTNLLYQLFECEHTELIIINARGFRADVWLAPATRNCRPRTLRLKQKNPFNRASVREDVPLSTWWLLGALMMSEVMTKSALSLSPSEVCVGGCVSVCMLLLKCFGSWSAKAYSLHPIIVYIVSLLVL